MIKTDLDMKIVNNVIAFKMLDILRDNGLIDISKYKNVEKKRAQYNENVLKKKSIYKGGV